MSRQHATAGSSSKFIWTDVGFATVFTICFTLISVYAYKAFKLNPQMISLPNILVMALIQITLISKFSPQFRTFSSYSQLDLSHEPGRNL